MDVRPEQSHPVGPPPPSAGSGEFWVALTGNPNCGKTTIFNALTGLRAKVGNYAGVTVERKEGRLIGLPPDLRVTLLDLPGTYSLSPQSLDEQIARDVLFHHLAEVPAPNAVVVVVDAANLERNLYYATQVIELGYPVVVALNMMDVAAGNGHHVDVAQLQRELGVPVVATVANTREGLPQLRGAIVAACRAEPGERPNRFGEWPELFVQETEGLATLLQSRASDRPGVAGAEAALALSDDRGERNHSPPRSPEFINALSRAREHLESAGIEWRTVTIEARYGCVAQIAAAAVTESPTIGETLSDKLDRVFTHKVWGVVIFVALMALMFQSIFRFAQLPMDLLQNGVGWIGAQLGQLLPPGELRSLLVDGVVQGVGAVVVFLPQICLLFLFIGLLEDTGYMARAAFLMDRLMSKVGLHGKSFIPMLSSFACAIPGIMATRTIESPQDRLVTILVAPLMSCSARLPVYTLLIAACIPNRKVLGLFGLAGLTLLAMYLLGIVMALTMAWFFKRVLLRGRTPMLIMELPPYKRPLVGTLLRHMWDRAKIFLRRAGTVILGINILLWFLATYPHNQTREHQYAAQRAALQQQVATGSPQVQAHARAELGQLSSEEAGAALRHSFAGRLGRLIEPVLRPLGFDWKIGIGILSSFAAREVFVSTMAVVYNVGSGGDTENSHALTATLQQQRRPNGALLYTPLTGITLMVFYVLALQCASTVAIVRRETNSWRWPLFQWAYMGGLAWLLAFAVYQGGRALGWH